MKRIAIVILSGLVMAASVSAQVVPANQAAVAQTITKVEGKLALVNGMIAIQAKDKTYYVGGLQHLIGFVDGLKEGASVKAEGYAVPVQVAPEYLHLRLTKLTFNGKDYDLSQAGGPGMMGGRGMMDGRGYGSDGRSGATQPGMGRGQSGGMMGGRGNGGRW